MSAAVATDNTSTAAFQSAEQQNSSQINDKVIDTNIQNNNNKNDSSAANSPSPINSARLLSSALPVRRVKDGKIGRTSFLALDEYEHTINYPPMRVSKNPFAGCSCTDWKRRKNVHLAGLLEIRQGYRTDNWHRSSRRQKFQQAAPEDNCFSIIFKHPRFVCKSIDFIAHDKEAALMWVEALRQMLSRTQSQSALISFDEKLWLLQNFRKADLDRNGQIAFNELWRLLKRLNLQLSEQYVRALFQEIVSKGGTGHHREALTEDEFIELFGVLTDLPEYKSALRLATPDGNDQMDAAALQKFLSEEQQFKDIDVKKAEAIIDFCEPGGAKTDINGNGKPGGAKVLSINGFRRLLQSRWGHILREGHESIFMDMDQPLQCYFINSSHNTYLTGLQVHGNATVESYISALRKGSRLLELDIFDGENGEPQITHKRTFIAPISLRNVLKCIKNYAFIHNPFPVILTIENHVGVLQQRVMADIFKEILDDHLYIPPEDAHTLPLPSPNQLKKKVLLRGKASQILAATEPAIASNVPDEEDGSPEDPENAEAEDRQLPRSPIDAQFGRLIALPSVKLTPGNLYQDIKNHPCNGSPSLSERKVQAYLESNAPIAAYTATRIVKSFPGGIRQDSSNMDPVISWICGIQSAALNFQTCDEELDVNNGFFSINGNVGYILKPKVLLEGKDPRHGIDVKCTLNIAIICAQYLPKADPGSSGIIDPYVSVEIYGVPRDKGKVRTRAVHNNGFNPVWNENLSFQFYCPELAILRMCVKDFDSTSADEFIGECSVPVNSIRPGYSHVRLNTGALHSPDEAASLFIRAAFT